MALFGALFGALPVVAHPDVSERVHELSEAVARDCSAPPAAGAEQHCAALYLRRAELLLGLGRGPEAGADLRSAGDLGAAGPRMRLAWADLKRLQGEDSAAARLLTEVLEQESAGEYSLARIHRLEAERLQAAGEVEGAAEHALRAAQAAPRSTPELVLFTIQALTRAGRRVDALHLVESALLDLPHVVSLEAERADLLVALGRTGDALEWLDRLVEEAARSRQFARQARWLERKGDLLLATGSSGAAAAAYQEALRALKPARRIPASTAQRLEASRLSAEEAAAAGGTFEPRGGLLENRR